MGSGEWRMCGRLEWLSGGGYSAPQDTAVRRYLGLLFKVSAWQSVRLSSALGRRTAVRRYTGFR
jgi:hypothetical protein